MVDKYVGLDASARLVEIEGLVASAGAGDAGKIPALDAAGKLDNTLMPSGIGADTQLFPASENLASGDLVNIWDDAGTPRARKADATTTGKEAVGFVLAAVTSGNDATVYFAGEITGLTGLTGGARYFLSAATPGAVTATAPAATGNAAQFVGVARSATEMTFRPSQPVVRA